MMAQKISTNEQYLRTQKHTKITHIKTTVKATQSQTAYTLNQRQNQGLDARGKRTKDMGQLNRNSPQPDANHVQTLQT